MHLAAPSFAQVLFWACAVTACVMGVLVVVFRSPVASALALVATLCAVAGLFLSLGAQFIAMVQVIVYAGAIMVLFVFVIMLLQLRGSPRGGRTMFGPRVLGVLLGLGLLAQLGVVVTTATYADRPAQGAVESAVQIAAAGGLAHPDSAFVSPLNTQMVGQALYSRFLVPFEVTSVLLLVALVGAVVLAKRKF